MPKNKKDTKLIVIVAIVVVLIVLGGIGAYLAVSNNSKSKNIGSVNTDTKLTGNAQVQAVLDKVKNSTPTVTATRVVTESTDDNKALGKPKQYQYAGYFYDTRTESTEATTDNYGTTSGGAIEIFANSSDAKERAEYLEQFQTAFPQAGAYRVVDNVVLRASENYTASQQKQMLDLMQTAL
jgi:hypothetical protein